MNAGFLNHQQSHQIQTRLHRAGCSGYAAQNSLAFGFLYKTSYVPYFSKAFVNSPVPWRNFKSADEASKGLVNRILGCLVCVCVFEEFQTKNSYWVVTRNEMMYRWCCLFLFIIWIFGGVFFWGSNRRVFTMFVVLSCSLPHGRGEWLFSKPGCKVNI